MLNNITNFFNLIKTGMVKTQLESTDLIPTGTRDSGYSGSYKPTMIKYSDLASQILSGVPPLTIGITPIVSGSVGKLLYEGAGNVLNESPVFNIDPLTGFLGAGTSTPQYAIDMQFNTLGFYSAPNYYAYLGLNNGSFYLNSYSDFIFGTSSVGNGLIIKQNGNILINTGTDAGFKLDVNGTARVQGQLTTTTANAQFGAIGASTGEFRIDGVNGAAYAFSVYSSSTLRFGVTGFGGITAPGGLIISSTSDLNTTRLRLGTSSSTAPINIQAQSGNADTIVLKASNGVDQFIIKNATGNVLINTTTDAGYKLDVNGTARVNSTATTGLTITQGASGDGIVIQNGGYIQMASTRFRAFSSGFQFQDMSYNTKVVLSMSGFSYFNSGANYTFGSITEVTSAIVNVDSTTKGFLPPRMTTTEKNAIATPAAGLMVYDNTLNRPCFYNGTSWITL